jgi:hypothetical protein
MRSIFFLGALLVNTFSVNASPLVNFQVAQPPPLPADAKQCTVQVIQRTFGFSFGKAEVVQYAPPTDCGAAGSWAGVSMNMTVTSNGTQFDRLATFTFQNVEIWRTSTAEPVPGDGIIWSYSKDVTRYIPLFAKPGSLILELNNLLGKGLDGQYAATVEVTFFASSDKHPPAKQANAIIPLSTLKSDDGNEASVPDAFSTSVTLPQNSVEIYAEIYASGNGDEEFWYNSVANEFLPKLPPNSTKGQGPFREVRMLVDGQLAGVAFPYATIFTGGISPLAWSPIVAYGAFDLPTYFLDLTPFAPILADGKSHSITLDVASAEDDHSINKNWFVSGNLQVVTDSSSQPTTGKITSYVADPFAKATISGNQATNGDLEVTVTAKRIIHIEADVISGSGKTNHVVWSQDLDYSNTQQSQGQGAVNIIDQHSTGTIISTHNGVTALSDKFSYPLSIKLSASQQSFGVDIDHSYERVLFPSPFILDSNIVERQIASVGLEGNDGNRASKNTFTYQDSAGNSFDREFTTSAKKITSDHQGGSLAAAP